MDFDRNIFHLFFAIVSPFALISIAWWVRARLPKRPASRRERHCRTCGYDCSGVWPTPRCPECGSPPNPAEPAPPPFRAVGRPLALLAGPFAIVLVVLATIMLDRFVAPRFPSVHPWIARGFRIAFLGGILGSVWLATRRMRQREARRVWLAMALGALLGLPFALHAASDQVSVWPRAYATWADTLVSLWQNLPGLAGLFILPPACLAGIAALLSIRLRRRREALAHAPSPTAGATG